MTKLGTCKFTYQIQTAYSFPADIPTPTAEEMEQYRVIDTSDRYTCQWLDQFKHDTLPPPIKRANGGFYLRDEDCDSCLHYQPASPTTSGDRTVSAP